MSQPTPGGLRLAAVDGTEAGHVVLLAREHGDVGVAQAKALQGDLGLAMTQFMQEPPARPTERMSRSSAE